MMGSMCLLLNVNNYGADGVVVLSSTGQVVRRIGI